MKKITILGLILLGLGFSPLLVSADVVSPGYHYLNRCIKVVNLNDYPEISLIAHIGDLVIESESIKEIENNVCISKGNRNNFIDIYWNYKDKYSIIDESKLLIERLDYPISNNYLKDKDPLIREEVEYSLVKTGESYILKKTKIVSEYNNGKPNKVEIFDDINKNQIINEVKKEFKPVVKNDTEQEIKKEVTQDVAIESDDIFKPEQNIIKKNFWQKIKCFFGFRKNC